MLPDGVRRLFRLGRARDVARELDDELAFHFEQKIEALVAQGLTADAAREEAHRQFGDLKAARRSLLAMDRGEARQRERREYLSEWLLDLRFALRSLSRTPGLAITIIVLLAAGIGANAAMLGILDRLLLRAPPHLVDPSSLAVIRVTRHRPGQPDYTRGLVSYPDVEDYAAGVPGFSLVAGYSYARPVPLDGQEEHLIRRAVVTRRYFDVLGTRPFRGRTYDDADQSGPPVAVISYDFWRRRFDGRESALGDHFRIGPDVFTVIGIMPRGFSGAEVDAADAWTLPEHGGLFGDWRAERRTASLIVVGRRRPGATDAQIASQVLAARSWYRDEERQWNITETISLASVIPGRRTDFDVVGVRLAVAVGVVAVLLLLIAVANITNLLLVRAVARVREFAVRAALGAGKGRLMRLVIAESVILAAGGGLAAGILGDLAGRGLRALLLPGYQWALPPLGLLTGLLAAALSLLIGLATGLLPGFLAARPATLGALRSGIRTVAARSRLRSALVAIQVALSVLLCVGTGLFTSSLVRSLHADRGLALRQMVLATIGSLDGNKAAQDARLATIVDRLKQVPGVTDVAVTTAAPLDRLDITTLKAEGSDSVEAALSYRVAPGFFAAGGLRLLAGRGFGPGDIAGAERVAIVDSNFAARAWRNQPAVGRCVMVERESGCIRVVGIVAYAMPNTLKEAPEPQVYFPLTQGRVPDEYALLVRASDDVDAVAEGSWRVLHDELPALKRAAVRTYASMLEPELRPWRVAMILFSASALLAIVLSSVGAYAVMAFAVRQRLGEFGIRRALGARAGHIVRLVLHDGLAMAGAGAVLGLAGATYVARYVEPMLYGTSPRDPAILSLAASVILASALLAGLGAARLALRVDPRQALQAD